MAMPHTAEMTPEQLKFLAEIGTLGSRQAAAALSTLLKVPVSVCALRTMQLPVVDITRLPQLPGDVFLGVYFTLYGEGMGRALVMVSRDDACRLADVACGKPLGSTRILDEYAQSAVREIGNIVTGAYLSAIRSVVPVPLVHSIPYLAMDQWRAIFDSLLTSLAAEMESVVLIEAEMAMETINTHFLLMFVAGKWAF